MKMAGRILVADDNEVWRGLLRDILLAAGYEVSLADSGERAIELAQTMPHAMILVDLNMPGLSGLDTTRRLREIPGMEAVPIVLLTDEKFAGDCEDPPTSLVNGYMQKKDALDQLVDCVKSHLD
jgi:CheY-like chemotaxis protein